MEEASKAVEIYASPMTETMVTLLTNATTDMITIDFGLSFSESVNDTYDNVDDVGGYHHGYGHNPLAAAFLLYFKLVVDVIGLLGNTVVILLVTFFHDLHSAANYHFLNMAIADFILLLENLLTRISEVIDFDMFVAWKCVPVYLHTVVVQTSSLTIAALSIDRFKLIVRPLKNLRERSPAKVFISLIAVWFVSFALHIPLLLYSVQSGSHCRMILPWVHGRLVYGIYSNVVLFFLPAAIVIYCNLAIIVRIRRRKPGVSYQHNGPKAKSSLDVPVSEENGLAGNNASTPAANMARPPTTTTPAIDTKPSSRRTRSTRIVVTVVIVFIACNLPFYAFFTVWLFPGALPWRVFFDVHTYLALLLLLNSAINPFIYSFMGSKYRNHIRQALCFLCSADKLYGSTSNPPKTPPKQGAESDRIAPR